MVAELIASNGQGYDFQDVYLNDCIEKIGSKELERSTRHVNDHLDMLQSNFTLKVYQVVAKI